VLILLAWLGAMAFGGDDSTLSILLAALYVWLPLITLLAAAIALSLRDRAGALALFAGASAMMLLFGIFPHGEDDPSNQPHTDLRVLELNTLIGAASPSELVALVRSSNPDVVILTETDPNSRARFKAAGLDQLLPYNFSKMPKATNRQHYVNMFGTDIWSKTPLENKYVLPGTVFPIISATTVVRGTEFTVVGLHAFSPVINRADWRNDLRLIGYYLESRKDKSHMVVAGDFNATAHHAPFDQIVSIGFKDAADYSDWAFNLNTWPTQPNLPLLRLDHVLVPPNVYVKSFKVHKISLSDHAAVTAELVYPSS